MEDKLPNNWSETQLIELLDSLQTGVRPKGGVQGILEGVPSIGGEHLNVDGGFKFKNIKYIPVLFADKLKRGRIATNDILIVKDGATTGRISFVDRKFPYDLAFVNEHVFLCRPSKKIAAKYLYYFMRSREGQNRIMANFAGAAQGGINTKFASNTLIPISPPAEQERIVTKLDTLFAQHEVIKTALDRIPQLLKDFRQQILTQAFTGRLTEDWRKERELGNVCNYFKEITKDLESYYTILLKKSFDNATTKPRNQKNNKVSDKGDPVLMNIPVEWQYFRAEDLCYLITDGVHFKPKYIESGIKFLSVKNVRPFSINTEACKYISEEDHLKYIQRCNPKYGDLLYTKVGATYGYAAKINLEYDFSIFVSLALIKPSKLINSNFLELLFNSPIIFNQANFKVSGIGVPDLHLIEIRDFKIPLPILEEQLQIVTRVESLFARATIIEAKYKALKAKVEMLSEALLHKAFQGKLVAQLRTDGDARDLLNEIKELKTEKYS